ncbi:MAG: sulfatase [Pirellulales bacterium]|nr:sulfatase [Pirellulales bacterium]
MERPPNVVIIYTDDQGYADVGCFGAQDFKTPNLDRLAQQGRKFTSFYVAQPVCSASRTALLTGCYPNRLGIHGALGPRDQHGISADETTLAEICKSRGYTTAIFGKWHLGCQEMFLPPNHGFDEFYGLPYSNDMWPWHPRVAHLTDIAERRKKGYPDLPLIEGTTVVHSEVAPEDQMRFTRQFTERAIGFIDRNHDRPFFLYLPHPMPHVPLFVSERFDGTSVQGRYGDVIQEIDWSVGQIMETLARHDIEDDTLVFFASDNGPWLSYGDHAGSAGILREGKGTTFEGGIRVPCIMRWPGHIPAGTVCDEPLMTIDILPTVTQLIGAELPKHKIDGKDVWPLLAGEEGAKSPQETYCFYYHKNALQALRSGKWKLHFPHKYATLAGQEGGRDGTPVSYSQQEIGYALFDLEIDPGETTDLAEKYPDVVARLKHLADTIRSELSDSLTGVQGNGHREPGRIAKSFK